MHRKCNNRQNQSVTVAVRMVVTLMGRRVGTGGEWHLGALQGPSGWAPVTCTHGKTSQDVHEEACLLLLVTLTLKTHCMVSGRPTLCCIYTPFNLHYLAQRFLSSSF